MMTTFWYYQPDDLEVRHAGIQCVEVNNYNNIVRENVILFAN